MWEFLLLKKYTYMVGIIWFYRAMYYGQNVTHSTFTSLLNSLFHDYIAQYFTFKVGNKRKTIFWRLLWERCRGGFCHFQLIWLQYNSSLSVKTSFLLLNCQKASCRNLYAFWMLGIDIYSYILPSLSPASFNFDHHRFNVLNIHRS